LIAHSDVVGSLLRPPALVAARKAHGAGSIGAAELKKVEDSEVDLAIAGQESAGLDVVTDGEFRALCLLRPPDRLGRRLRPYWRLGDPLPR